MLSLGVRSLVTLRGGHISWALAVERGNATHERGAISS
jgi:hypothetical protein